MDGQYIILKNELQDKAILITRLPISVTLIFNTIVMLIELYKLNDWDYDDKILVDHTEAHYTLVVH